MVRRICSVLVAGFLVIAQSACGGSSADSTALSSTKDVAEVVALSAGSMSQAGAMAAPDASKSLSVFSIASDISTKAISGFTFDSETGAWTGTTQFGATPTLRFYLKSDGSLITVDVTDESNYQPGGELFGVTPINQPGAEIQMQVTVVINKTLNAGYTLSAIVVTEKIDGESQNIGPDALYAYTGDSGTVTGTFGTINMSSIELTAAESGADVDGSYTFSVTVDGTTYNGTAQFDENGCRGATITDADGNLLGTAILNDSGDLVFTDASTGESSTISRIES